MLPSAPVTTPADWRLWLTAGVAALGFGLSLYNTYRGSQNHKDSVRNRDLIQRLDRENKARAIRLEEFRRSVRDPIRTALSQLRPFPKRLTAIAKTKISLDQLMGEIAEVNGAVSEALGSLMDELSAASDSVFAKGVDFAGLCGGYEDSIAEHFNSAQNSDLSVMDRLNAIEEAAGCLESLMKTVNERVDVELERQASATEAAI